LLFGGEESHGHDDEQSGGQKAEEPCVLELVHEVVRKTCEVFKTLQVW
jgi:hypothetical protein